MDRVAVGYADKNPVLGCAYLRVVGLTAFGVVVVPVKEVHSVFLEYRFHSHHFYAFRRVVNNNIGAQLVDRFQIVEIDPSDDGQLRGQFIIIIGDRCFGQQDKRVFDIVIVVNQQNFVAVSTDRILPKVVDISVENDENFEPFCWGHGQVGDVVDGSVEHGGVWPYDCKF